MVQIHCIVRLDDVGIDERKYIEDYVFAIVQIVEVKKWPHQFTYFLSTPHSIHLWVSQMDISIQSF